MTLLTNLGTPQFFVFQTIVSLVIIFSSFTIYLRTHQLYTYSMQRGVKYFSNAFLVYGVCFTVAYIGFLMIYFSVENILSLLFVNLILLFTGALGGFYLAYGLVWRNYERDSLSSSFGKPIFIIAALILAVLQTYFILQGMQKSYAFYLVMLPVLSWAVLTNLRLSRKKKQDPFISIVVLALGIYIAIFLTDLVSGFLPTIYYYVWGLNAVFFHTVAHNVNRFRR